MTDLVVKLTSEIVGGNINALTDLLNIDSDEACDALRKIFSHFRKKKLFIIEYNLP
jgi:hypothetical protein